MCTNLFDNRKKKERRLVTARPSGFTLIELMVVLVILGILAGLVIPRMMNRPDDARRLQTRIQIKSIETALKLYRLDNDSYPTTDQGLAALILPPQSGRPAARWRQGGYLDGSRLPRDPWGNEYIYIAPGLKNDFDLLSYGADGKPGGTGNDADIQSSDIE